MKKLMIVSCMILAGCETLSGFRAPQPGSYAPPEIVSSDSSAVARDMAGFLANQFPYAKTTLALEPIKTDFNQVFVWELARRGFGIVEGNPIPGSVEVHYAVSFLDNGIVARMRFQGKEASRFYAATETGVRPGGRYALRSAIK